MFRDMRRKKQQVEEAEAKAVIAKGMRGTLSLIGDDGYPYGVPLDYYYDEAENQIYFHGAKDGHKIDAINTCDKACFTIWNEGYKKEGDWAFTITSVIAFGRVSLPTDPDLTAEKVRKIAVKYFPTDEIVEEEMKSIDRTQLFVFDIEHMTGKQIHEK